MPKQKVKELYTIPSWAPPNNAQPLAEGSLDVKNAKGYGMPMFEEYIWPHISSYFKKQSEVLDVGSGTGRHSKFFSSRVKTATAIDHCTEPQLGGYDQKLIKDISNVEFVNMDFMNYYPQKRYDVVFLSGSFYHLFQCYKDKAFKKLLTFMKQNNSVLILVEGPDITRPYCLSSLLEDHSVTLLKKVPIPQFGPAVGSTVSVITLGTNIKVKKDGQLNET
tara:strand:+ start:3711 stop:4370 length:660 start_codon:yes stop_codon:yes gene_type:complete